MNFGHFNDFLAMCMWASTPGAPTHTVTTTPRLSIHKIGVNCEKQHNFVSTTKSSNYFPLAFPRTMYQLFLRWVPKRVECTTRFRKLLRWSLVRNFFGDNNSRFGRRLFLPLRAIPRSSLGPDVTSSNDASSGSGSGTGSGDRHRSARHSLADSY